MKPKYIFRKEGTGYDTSFLVLDAQTEREAYRFASLEDTEKKGRDSPGCKEYLGWGCLAGLVGLFFGEINFEFGGSGSSPIPRKWAFRRADGYDIFQLHKIRRGFDVLRDGSSIGRIEWKKWQKIVNHQLILGDQLIATEIPTGLLRNEIHIEIENGRLATLKNTNSMTSTHFGEFFIKRELRDEELGLILGVGLLWL